jgi:hypothetical protein
LRIGLTGSLSSLKKSEFLKLIMYFILSLFLVLIVFSTHFVPLISILVPKIMEEWNNQHLNSDFCKLLTLQVSPILKIQKCPLGMLIHIHALLTLASPSGYALNLKSLIKVSKVSWTIQLSYGLLRSSLEQKFD